MQNRRYVIVNQLLRNLKLPMRKNFTSHNHSNFVIDHQQEVKKMLNSPGENEPSESVIQHLLNYSRALMVIETKLSGTKSILLLN